MRSEVALLKERLQLEAEAAFQGIYGYAAAAQHQIIHQKMQIVNRTFNELKDHIGEDEADTILVAAMDQAAYEQSREGKTEELQALAEETEATTFQINTVDLLPDKPARAVVLQVLRSSLGPSAETEHLLDWLEDLWETLDLLIRRFGAENAQKIVYACPAMHREVGRRGKPSTHERELFLGVKGFPPF